MNITNSSAPLTSAPDRKATENILGHKSGNERTRESKYINVCLTSLSDKKDAIKVAEHANKKTLIFMSSEIIYFIHENMIKGHNVVVF